MNRIPVFIILLYLTSTLSAALAPGMAPETPLLRDGFVLTGVDGSLVGPDSPALTSPIRLHPGQSASLLMPAQPVHHGPIGEVGAGWFFELASDVNDSSSVLKAGTRLELLPSSGLEKMIADAKLRSTAAYRLWDGRVTKYKGSNYIFPNYFQPLREPALSAVEGPQDAERETEGKPLTSDLGKSDLAVDEPNDVLTMPPEILEKLRARREKGTVSGQGVADSNRAAAEATSLSNVKSYRQSADTILADRTAFLVKEDEGRLVLTPDALGRNVQRLTLRLLPCEVLELTEREQSAEPEPIRFRIAGVMTEYKGNSYLLLQRATRAYSHGNFGR